MAGQLLPLIKLRWLVQRHYVLARHIPAPRMNNKADRLTALFRLTSVKRQATVMAMKIRSFTHKGLKRLYEGDSAKGLSPDSVDKLRKMLAFLDAMQDPEELRALATWKAHILTGDRKGVWSLSVTRNHRLTFRIDDEKRICDLNVEDYH